MPEFDENDRYYKLARSHSLFDRIIYLFGGVRFFALLLAVTGMLVGASASLISILQITKNSSSIFARSAPVSQDRLANIKFQASQVSSDAERLKELIGVVRRATATPSTLNDNLEDVRQSLAEIDDIIGHLKGTSNAISLLASETRSGFNIEFIGSANAQTLSGGTAPPAPMVTIDALRPIVMLFVIVTITVFFGVCIWLFCKSPDPERLKFADNMIRTIIGFYIGIVTGLLGLPAAR